MDKKVVCLIAAWRMILLKILVWSVSSSCLLPCLPYSGCAFFNCLDPTLGDYDDLPHRSDDDDEILLYYGNVIAILRNVITILL